MKSTLPEIPVTDITGLLGVETLEAHERRAHRLIDSATRGVPRQALRALDAVSRKWLVRWNNAQLDEIDRVAKLLGRPGAYFLSVNYEWGCTCRVAPSPEGGSARMARVLDWLPGTPAPDTTPPIISAVYPNGGESLETGEQAEITWAASDNYAVISIDILLSTDSGATWSETIAEGEANTGSYIWTVSEGASDQCRVRVIARDGAGLAAYDDSDADFSKGSTTGGPDSPELRNFYLAQNLSD